MLTLVIGNKNSSSWSLRPWLLLRVLEVPFDEVHLPLDTPEFRARIGTYSPARRVPVLIDGNTTVWDSLSICEYVNEMLQGRAWPHEREQRAHARSISAEMHAGFTGLRQCWSMDVTSRLEVTLTIEAQKDIERIEAIWLDCQRRYGGPWLFGRAFSVADAMYAPIVLRFNTYGARLSAPALAYMQQVLDNEHLQAWIRGAEQEMRV